MGAGGRNHIPSDAVLYRALGRVTRLPLRSVLATSPKRGRIPIRHHHHRRPTRARDATQAATLAPVPSEGVELR